MKTKTGYTRVVEVKKDGVWQYWCVCYKCELDYQISCLYGYAKEYRWRLSGSDKWHYGFVA